MSPEQCRAARAWLNWTQVAFAEKAGVGLSTVKDFEGERRAPIANNRAAMQAALEKAGIAFVDDGKAFGLTGPKPSTG